MKFFLHALSLVLMACISASAEASPAGNTADVRGIRMYYEIHGTGQPLVLIHGGGSTFDSTFDGLYPLLARTRKIIGVELQAHGRTSDRPADSTFEQDADDVAALLKKLNVKQADFFGFSNGGNTALRIATRHPKLVRSLIVGSAFYQRQGMIPGFWDEMEQSTVEKMPKELRDAFLKVNPNPGALRKMHDRDAHRMQTFRDWDERELTAISAPVLVTAADKDVVLPEHTVQLYKLFPHGRLAILPGDHGSYLAAETSPILSILEGFLTGQK